MRCSLKLSFVFLSFLLFLSCQKTGDVKSQTIHLSIPYDPPSLDPRRSGENLSFFVLKQCYEGLFRQDLQGNIQPAIVKSYEVSKDGLRYIFVLKETVWSDGKPVSAYDFERTWKSTLSPQLASLGAEALYCLKNGKDAHLGKSPLEAIGVSALDTYKLQVDLQHPAPYFLHLLSHPIFAPVSDPYNQSISNGPFLISEWKTSDHILLEKNPNYWDKSNVHLNTVTIDIVSDPQTALLLFEKGKLDWLGYPISNIPADALSSPTIKQELRFSPYYTVNYYIFNTDFFPLNNLNIRKALALSLNREDIVQHVTQLGEKPAYSLIPPELLHGEHIPLFQEDPALAKELLNEGLRELGLKANQLPPLTLSYNTFETNHKVAQTIQEQWTKTLGVDVKLENKEWKVYLDDITQGNYQIARLSRYSSKHDAESYIENFDLDSTAGFRGNWSSPPFSHLFHQALQTSSPEKRESLLRQAEAIIISEMPIIPLYFRSGVYLKNPLLNNVYISPFMEMDLKHASMTPQGQQE